jgi:hypothetical protein
VENIDSLDPDADLIVINWIDLDVWFAEHDEQIAAGRGLQRVRHMQIGVHSGLQDWNTTKAIEFSRMRIEIEGAGDDDIEVDLTSLLCGGNEIGTRDYTEFGTNEDRCTAFLIPLHIAAFAADQFARPWRKRSERDAVFLVGLLDASRLEVFKDHLREVACAFSPLCAPAFNEIDRVDQAVVRINREHAMGRQSLDSEWSGNSDARSVGVGLVVKIFELGFGGDRCVNFLLPNNPSSPPFRMELRCLCGPVWSCLTRDFPFFPGLTQRVVQVPA